MRAVISPGGSCPLFRFALSALPLQKDLRISHRLDRVSIASRCIAWHQILSNCVEVYALSSYFSVKDQTVCAHGVRYRLLWEVYGHESHPAEFGGSHTASTTGAQPPYSSAWKQQLCYRSDLLGSSQRTDSCHFCHSYAPASFAPSRISAPPQHGVPSVVQEGRQRQQGLFIKISRIHPTTPSRL